MSVKGELELYDQLVISTSSSSAHENVHKHTSIPDIVTLFLTNDVVKTKRDYFEL